MEGDMPRTEGENRFMEQDILGFLRIESGERGRFEGVLGRKEDKREQNRSAEAGGVRSGVGTHDVLASRHYVACG